mgnify:CR=1 FL=1
MSLLKKIALVFPPVKRVQADLENRRKLAVEYESANELIVQQNDDLLRQLDYMKTELAKALNHKDAAVSGKSGLSANAEHYQAQCKVIQAKYDTLKEEQEKLDVENYLLRIENASLTKMNTRLKAEIGAKHKTSRSTRTKEMPKQRKKA